MADLVWTKALVIPSTNAGCGASGVCCLGNARMLAYAEDIHTVPANPDPQHIYRSPDNGQTWTLLVDVLEGAASGWANQPGRMANLGLDKAMVASYPGPIVLSGGGVTSYGPAPYTGDGGATWAQHYDNITPYDGAAFGYTVLSQTEIILYGIWWPDDTYTNPYHMLLSHDGGMTWSQGAAIPNLQADGITVHGISLGGDVLLAGTSEAIFGAITPQVYRSTDGGTSWSPVSLPVAGSAGNNFAVMGLASLGSGVVLVGGQTNTADPRLWRSTDSGQTFTEITSALPLLESDTREIMDIVSPAPGVAVIALMAGPLSSHRFWRLTVDGGVTWTNCTMSHSTGATGMAVPQGMAVADDGAVICPVDVNANGILTELWRGVPVGFTAIGPCASLVPPEAKVMGCPALCGLPIFNNPCPQECDVSDLPTTLLRAVPRFGRPQGATPWQSSTPLRYATPN